MTKTTLVWCKYRPLKRADGISPPTSLGELITEDHQILNLEDSQEMITRTLSSFQTDAPIDYSVILRKEKKSDEQYVPWGDSSSHFKRQEESVQTIQKQFIKACQDLEWTHDTDSPHRSEINGIAERAVRREKWNSGSDVSKSTTRSKWC